MSSRKLGKPLKPVVEFDLQILVKPRYDGCMNKAVLYGPL
jgi:hypothetical protein